MAAILSSQQTFLPEAIPEVEYTRNMAISISDIWAFDRRFSSIIDGDISISKFDPLCDVVTSPMTSWMRIYISVVIVSGYLCTGSLMMICLLIFSYHEKYRYSIYKGIRRADFDVTLWRHRWRHHHEKYFCLHNLGRSWRHEYVKHNLHN